MPTPAIPTRRHFLQTTAATSDHRAKRDANFQGFGRFLTASTGDYYFRTVKPVPYPGRTPHIHSKIKQGVDREFNTQCYIKGHPQNERDGVYNEIRDKQARDSVTIDCKPIADSKANELEAHFDIILGVHPKHAQS
ncbi:MAG TPA: hypothetical protein VH107_00940 [Lacipirellulaceae bacterium]|jgi:protocatechuate 3,4-dioxygenase beta subunit|nr:hypothetical protein [Lacipirellulaceae bacterium]